MIPKKTKKNWRLKNGTLVVCNDFDECPFGKFFSYGHDENGNSFDVSLDCPIPSCQFGGFGRLFDDCSDD